VLHVVYITVLHVVYNTVLHVVYITVLHVVYITVLHVVYITVLHVVYNSPRHVYVPSSRLNSSPSALQLVPTTSLSISASSVYHVASFTPRLTSLSPEPSRRTPYVALERSALEQQWIGQHTR
jgi:hypothetical protein